MFVATKRLAIILMMPPALRGGVSRYLLLR